MGRYASAGIVVVALGALPIVADAGTIRHDVPTEEYILRSEAYSNVAMMDGDAGTGSGTFITPQWILTAGHVAGGVYDPEFGDIVEHSVIYVHPFLNAFDGILEGIYWTADQWIAHPNWTGHLGDGYDVGLIHIVPRTQEEIDEFGGPALPQVTPAGRYFYTPAPGEPATQDPLLGTLGTTVGYGLTGDGRDGFEVDINYWDFYRRAGDTMIDLVGSQFPGLVDEFNGNVELADQFFVGDFDDPPTQSGWTKNNINRMGGDDALPYEYSVAPADSGGPLFVDHDNDPNTPQLIAGINSWIEGPDGTDNGSYDDIFGFARVSLFNDWINSVINAAMIGDANSDGVVDIEDLKLLATYYGLEFGAQWHNGDFDFDGDVDLNDLANLAAHYTGGQSQAYSDFQSLASVPEPSALLSLSAAALFGLARRRRPAD